MGKTATLNLRVNPDVKENAESVLEQLGIPMATAIDMYLKQISLVGGIPFSYIVSSIHKKEWVFCRVQPYGSIGLLVSFFYVYYVIQIQFPIL